MAGGRTIHAFSLDVEDWYQSSYDFNASISEICVQNTRKALIFLERHRVKGTFFIQGMVAKSYPQLIKEIDKEGHEIQSHGFSHRPVNGMSPKEFYTELYETKTRLEDLTGKPVVGFRAPDFSIDNDTLWAFEVMLEAGLTYDSSIFPMKTVRYGIKGFKRGYSIIHTASGNIEELTVSVDELPIGIRLPVGGGGYIRLLPNWLLRFCLNKFDGQEIPFVVYCHPYEFNPTEWEQILKYVPRLRRIHQGIGRRGFSGKLTSLLKSKPFGPMSKVMEGCREKYKESKS